jgi:L-threonylcarbamoyladenylate synthase
MNKVTSDEAVELLMDGNVGVMPTDTVYGLVARAEDAVAVTQMYSLKNREQKPGTLIAANTDQLVTLGVPQSEIDKVAKWWPNPVSAVLTVNGNNYLHQNVATLAMRVVADPKVRGILEQTGPLITSSANQPGKPPATTIDEAIAYFGDDVDFYVDGGTIADALPSTIIRPTPDGIEVLRQGSISL